MRTSVYPLTTLLFAHLKFLQFAFVDFPYFLVMFAACSLISDCFAALAEPEVRIMHPNEALLRQPDFLKPGYTRKLEGPPKPVHFNQHRLGSSFVPRPEPPSESVFRIRRSVTKKEIPVPVHPYQARKMLRPAHPNDALIRQANMPRPAHPNEALIRKANMPRPAHPNEALIRKANMPRPAHPNEALIRKASMPRFAHPNEALIRNANMPRPAHPNEALIRKAKMPRPAHPNEALIRKARLH